MLHVCSVSEDDGQPTHRLQQLFQERVSFARLRDLHSRYAADGVDTICFKQLAFGIPGMSMHRNGELLQRARRAPGWCGCRHCIVVHQWAAAGYSYHQARTWTNPMEDHKQFMNTQRSFREFFVNASLAVRVPAQHAAWASTGSLRNCVLTQHL